MRLLLAAMFLLSALSVADARTRVVITTPSLPGHWVPGTVLYWFSKNVCTFVAWSVDPSVPAGDYRLGKCPPRTFVWPL